MNRRGGKRQYTCRLCGLLLSNRAELHIHRAQYHRQQFGGGELQETPFDDDEHPFDNFPDEAAMEKIYSENEVYILAVNNFSNANVLVFNFPLTGSVTDDEIESQLTAIYESEATQSSFKLQMGAGVILRDVEDGSLRYFRPEANSYILDYPLTIDGPEALEAAITYLQTVEIDELVRGFRPNSRYVVQFVCQLEYHIFPIDYPLGAKVSAVNLPDYIRGSKSIVTEFDDKGYENCCLFVALSQHRHPQRRRYHHRRQVQDFLLQWFRYCHENHVDVGAICGPAKFKGVDWSHMPHFENCFQINVCIMQLLPNKTAVTKYCVRKTFSDTLYVNEHERHLNYICSIELYSRRHKCDHCYRLFKKPSVLQRHRLTCGKKSRYIYSASAFRYFKTLFEELEEIGIVVPAEDRYYPYVTCFDLEAALEKIPQLPDEGDAGDVENLAEGQENIDREAAVAAAAVGVGGRRKKKATTFHFIHRPISCAIASNVPGHTEAICIVEEDPEEMVKLMFEKFYAIRICARELARNKWGGYLTVLEEKVEARRSILSQQFKEVYKSTREDEGGAVVLADVDRTAEYVRLEKYYMLADPLYNQFQNLYRQFYLYIHRTILLTFNGSRYDVPLLKGPMIKFLLDNEKWETLSLAEELRVGNGIGSDEDEEGEYDAEREFALMYGVGTEHPDDYANDNDYEDGEQMENDPISINSWIRELKLDNMGPLKVIKRGSAHISMSNNFYTFLDVVQYLAPGCNYKRFLRAYNGGGEEKGYWCYEHIDSFQKLYETLPPYPSAAWESSLKGGIDLLDEEHADWLANGGKGEEPLTGREVYANMQEEWEVNGYTCLMDMLRSYNKKDVTPFVLALENMLKEYFAMGLDVFKISVSAPGLSRILMMRHAQKQEVLFPLFGKEDRDAYWLYKASICAGASIIFNRFCQVGQTYLRPDNKYVCQGVFGYDYTSLYLGLFNTDMPTTMYVRRFEEDKFKAQYRPQIYAQYVWVRYIARTNNIFIKTRLNQGRDIKVGPYFVDGLSVGDGGEVLILEFLGCFFHFHCSPDCLLTKGGKKGIEGAYQKWLDKKLYLEKLNYKVLYIWECEMEELMRCHPHLKAEMEAMKPAFLKIYPGVVSMEQIVESIKGDLFFGFLEVDIEVPKERYHEFEDLPPIFSNHDIKFEDIGPVMQQYIRARGKKFTSRRLLTSGMSAKGLLLNSELAAYYLNVLGLKITRIYQTMEFVPKKPFSEFVSAVTQKRQEAVLNPDRKVIGELYKLMGE